MHEITPPWDVIQPHDNMTDYGFAKLQHDLLYPGVPGTLEENLSKGEGASRAEKLSVPFTRNNEDLKGEIASIRRSWLDLNSKMNNDFHSKSEMERLGQKEIFESKVYSYLEKFGGRGLRSAIPEHVESALVDLQKRRVSIQQSIRDLRSDESHDLKVGDERDVSMAKFMQQVFSYLEKAKESNLGLVSKAPK